MSAKSILEDALDRLPFWEWYQNWNNAAGPSNNVSSSPNRRVYLVENPADGKKFVVKDRDLDEDAHRLYSDSRITALFQGVVGKYGVRTLDEVTVLPSKELFYAKAHRRKLRDRSLSPQIIIEDDVYIKSAERFYQKKKDRGIRVAEFAPVLSGDRKKNLSEEKEGLLEAWFPKSVFDYVKTVRLLTYPGKNDVRVDHPRQVESTYSLDVINLNLERFGVWFKEQKGAELEKIQKSIAAIHRMVNDGFLFDMYGPLNFALHEGEIVIMDVEPITVSRLPQGTTCVGDSEETLNGIFSVAGLPEIKFGDVISRIYGKDKYLRLKSRRDAVYTRDGCLERAIEEWETNVTPQEELEHYKATFREMSDVPVRPSSLPPELLESAERYIEEIFKENEKA
jgi:hypothetical protein